MQQLVRRWSPRIPRQRAVVALPAGLATLVSQVARSALPLRMPREERCFTLQSLHEMVDIGMGIVEIIR